MKIIIVVLVIFGVGSMPCGALAEEQRAVLVTGASTGIGLKIATVLADNGFHVYAGARKAADLERLNAMKNMTSLKLDVTVQDEIDAAVDFIKSEGRGLYGIVNNAGVAVITRLATGPESDLSFIFDVNVYGPYRINQAFLPMITESGGRTTIIGSISGFIARTGGGAYSMSKFAVEAYTDSLADEVSDSGIHVSIVEPGGFKSKIREKLTLSMMGGVATSDDEKLKLREAVARNETLKEPDEVAAAVMHFLTSDKPKRRYMVTPNQQEADATIRASMTRLLELNEDQPYRYSREQLIALIDDLLNQDRFNRE